MAWLVVLGEVVALVESSLVTVALGFARSTGAVFIWEVGAPRVPEAESKRQNCH